MSVATGLRHVLAFATALAALSAGAAPAAQAQGADGQGAGGQGAGAAPPTTTLTFKVPDCNGCELTLIQARWDRSAGSGVRVWNGPHAVVRRGKATFTVPRSRTTGLSVAVSAPWDGQLAAVTTVAFRYAGHDVGDRVSFADARDERRAAACWAGTRRSRITIPLTVRKVRVEGVRGRTDGTIAYARTTRAWMQPMRRSYAGVLASQDVNVCGSRD